MTDGKYLCIKPEAKATSVLWGKNSACGAFAFIKRNDFLKIFENLLRLMFKTLFLTILL